MGTTNQSAAVELPDDELGRKLRALKGWTRVKKWSIPTLGIGWFALAAIFGSQEMWGALIATIAIAFVLTITLYILAEKKTKKLKDLMGSAVTQPILREVFEVTNYIPNGHIESKEVNDASLIYDWDRIDGSDFIEGTYKGIRIQFSDLHLQREEEYRDEDGHKKTRYITVFKGQWLICDFDRELAAILRLFERKTGTKWNSSHDVSKSSIETENIEFNKKFKILTSDGHTAFYVLTPHFMERLMAVDEAADASSFFCFKDGRVHIALHSGRDSFELKGVKVRNMDDVRQKFRRDLKYMTDIVDELLLNDRLFKAE